MTMMMLPAAPGTCAMCATKHDPLHAHNLTSLFYGMRFKLKYGRDPTWADACAHLPAKWRERWREAMAAVGEEPGNPLTTWSEPPAGVEPIAEPYAVSAP